MKNVLTRLRKGIGARLCRFGREERGVQLAELAIILPLLLVMFAAIAEFGHFFYTYATLAKATRAGARYIAAKPMTNTERGNTRALVVYGNTSGDGDALVGGLETSNIQITSAPAGAALPQTVTVEIDSFNYQPLFDLGALVGSPSLSLNIEIRPSTTMRYLLTQPSA